MKTLTLVSGGARSGKSRYALQAAAQYPASRKYFIATAEALDEEMAARIAHHKASRPSDFATIEAPVEIVRTLNSLDQRADVAVVDCLTLWVSNLLGTGMDDETVMREAEALARALDDARFACVVVTDEVGSGIVPEHPIARRFRDLLGWTNQKIAEIADEVILMVAGCPLRVK
ncbi:MAG: bifunctional adenosylcobinamide kinase/adenosylcobinamide-phosphate guanylyltransferase [Candidatus Binataceae bacterium]